MEQIRKYREEAGITQLELAERANLSRTTIVNYETGRRIPRWDHMEKIAAVLGKKMEAFANPTSSPSPEGGPKEKPRPIMKDRHKRKVVA